MCYIISQLLRYIIKLKDLLLNEKIFFKIVDRIKIGRSIAEVLDLVLLNKLFKFMP